MVSEELRKYIDMVATEEDDDQLYEMANLGEQNHGIDDVVIWVGKANKQHGLRVKVSNIKNHWSTNDNFVIQMPSLDYDSKQVAKWIDRKVMTKILDWIKLNYAVLHDYENDNIVYTDDFMDRLVKL